MNNTSFEELFAKVNVSPAAVSKALMDIAPFVGRSQFHVLSNNADIFDRGHCEEYQYFRELILKMAGIIERMPKTYEQDERGDNAIVHLHYFIGGADWWITEKDRNAANDVSNGIQEQSQAFGLCRLFPGGEEMGYVSLPEILEANAELDLHWEPKTVAEVRANL